MAWKKFIVYFAQEHVNFRYPELQSLLRLFDIPHRLPSDVSKEVKIPFLSIELPSTEHALKLVSRSVAIKCVLEHWADAPTYPQFHSQLNEYIDANRESESFKRLQSATFRITVETFNKHIQQKQKIEKIETLTYLPFSGSIALKNFEQEYFYIEFYGLDPNNVPAEPDHILFGRWLANGNRTLINEISLKTRKFIGNTSMDATLSLLMANQAMVKRGDLVYDPFVGTGSLLVSAAKFGGYVMGTDIDYLMLHGKTKPTRIRQKVREKDESILLNMKQYNCDKYYVDILVSDFANSIWHRQVQFDSIITDPPYGIREAREKVQTKINRPLRPDAVDVVHYPSTSKYELSSLYDDLLRFAGKHLRIGGRLVCWIPIFRRDYSEDYIPKSDCLQLVANSEQYLSSIAARRLLTYQKIAEPGTINGTENVLDILDDFRFKFFTRDEKEREERRLQKIEIKKTAKIEAAKRGKILVDKEKK